MTYRAEFIDTSTGEIWTADAFGVLGALHAVIEIGANQYERYSRSVVYSINPIEGGKHEMACHCRCSNSS
jgi:hypothetical protein